MLRFGSILPRTKAGFGVKSRIKRSRKCTNFRGKSSQKDKDTNDDVNDEKDMNEDVSYTEDEEFFENVNTSPFFTPSWGANFSEHDRPDRLEIDAKSVEESTGAR